jgi:very-short-patch-repair endonuclease
MNCRVPGPQTRHRKGNLPPSGDTHIRNAPLMSAFFKGGGRRTEDYPYLSLKPSKYDDYNPKLKRYARHNRKNTTKSEIRLWTELLRAKKMLGYPFNRQRSIDQYIADFYAAKLKLIIEVDGWTHDDPDQQKRDEVRQNRLESLGYMVIRFTDFEVRNHLEEVCERIVRVIKEIEGNPPPSAPP